MQRKVLNILRKIVHQAGFIYKCIHDYKTHRGTSQSLEITNLNIPHIFHYDCWLIFYMYITMYYNCMLH